MPDSPFTLYGTFAGVTRVHAFATGDRIVDLELVGNLQSRIVSGYGEETGRQIWAGIHESLQETETSILRHIGHQDARSEEHTSELQSLMRISYGGFCLKKTNTKDRQKEQA